MLGIVASPLMTASTLFMVAGGVLILAILLFLGTSVHSDASSSQYERKRARRTAAITLFVVSLVLAAFGVLVLLQSPYGSLPPPSTQTPDYR